VKAFRAGEREDSAELDLLKSCSAQGSLSSLGLLSNLVAETTNSKKALCHQSTAEDRFRISPTSSGADATTPGGGSPFLQQKGLDLPRRPLGARREVVFRLLVPPPRRVRLLNLLLTLPLRLWLHAVFAYGRYLFVSD